MYKGPDTDINLHVFSLGTSEIDRMLWSYVNILDTKSQTFLCCTSS